MLLLLCTILPKIRESDSYFLFWHIYYHYSLRWERYSQNYYSFTIHWQLHKTVTQTEASGTGTSWNPLRIPSGLSVFSMRSSIFIWSLASDWFAVWSDYVANLLLVLTLVLEDNVQGRKKRKDKEGSELTRQTIMILWRAWGCVSGMMPLLHAIPFCLEIAIYCF